MNSLTTDLSRYPDVPVDPMFTKTASSGPMKSLYAPSPNQRVLGASRSFLYQCALFCLIAVVIWFLPFDIPTATPLGLMQIISLGLVWGGICILIPYFITRQFGTRIHFDLNPLLIRVFKKKECLTEYPLSDLRCLQICFVRYDDFRAHELNLCFSEGERLNLISVYSKSSARRMAIKLADFLGRDILDCTERGL
jgi:hypothetical protein